MADLGSAYKLAPQSPGLPQTVNFSARVSLLILRLREVSSLSMGNYIQFWRSHKSDFHRITRFGSKICHRSVTCVTCDTRVAVCDNYPAAQEEVDEPAGNLTGITLYLQMLSDIFDFTSQGHNNNRFEHFQQAGKSNVMKEMETYETVGMQTWQEAEVDMELGSDLREFALEFM